MQSHVQSFPHLVAIAWGRGMGSGHWEGWRVCGLIMWGGIGTVLHPGVKQPSRCGPCLDGASVQVRRRLSIL